MLKMNGIVGGISTLKENFGAERGIEKKLMETKHAIDKLVNFIST